MISEAAKQVKVETHVLRYWEEELKLPIKRNEMGHRYYTMEDVEQFREIKQLKEQGLQLKAIRTILQKESQDGIMLDVDKLISDPNLPAESSRDEEKSMDYIIGKKQRYFVSLSDDTSREAKASRLQYLLQHMMTEAVKNANRELCTEIKESILKELDYQFRVREEKEEEHWKKEEEHYRKVDEMLRQHYKVKEKPLRKEKKGVKFIKH